MEYKREAFQETGYVDGTSIGVEVLVAANKPFSDKSKSRIRHHCEMIARAVYEGTQEIDPLANAQAAAQKLKLLNCFPEKPVVIHTIDGYMGNKMFPWFVVQTKIGPITIGRRHSVIQISWQFGPTACELFPDENTTKSENTIHAYGYDKAKEYIAKLWQTVTS